MLDSKLHILPNFVYSLCAVRHTAFKYKLGLTVFSLLSVNALAQGPSVTALPYLLTNQGSSTVVVTLTPASPIISTDAIQSSASFSGLLGGGLGSVFNSPLEIGSAATEAASASGLLYIAKARCALKAINYVKQFEMQQVQTTENSLKVLGCNANFRTFHAHTVALDSPVCELTQEEQADQAEQDLQALDESGEASQEALESAEAAAEAAEAAAEAAVETAQGLEIGLDVAEGLVDLLSII